FQFHEATMESWNSVHISDSTKGYAWTGVMKAFKEDSSVPKYAKALLELLIEERREMLETQQRMVKIIDEIGRKVNDLASAPFMPKSGLSSSNQTPANSDSSNEALMDSTQGSSNLNSLLDSTQSTTIEIVAGEPLFYDNFANSSLLMAKEEEDDSEEFEDYAKSALHRLVENSAKAINSQRDSSSAPSSAKRKRPHSSGDANSLPGLPSLSDHYCRYQDCEETFESAAELEEHVRGHTYKQKHHCPVCGLGIRSETRLRDHMNQHTGERPYICEHCGKGFTRVDAKNGHTKKCSERETKSMQQPNPLLEELQQLLGAGSAAGAVAEIIENDEDIEF
ncbi:hypothetical protein PENTCL1PPCAC_7422, partial [Pristionchus entomophagus]